MGRSGKTFSTNYFGSLKDYKGDGTHVRLFIHTYGPDGLWHRKATTGRKIRYAGGPILANRLTFSICTYNRSKLMGCSREW
ncbi:MAG TPA: hypothetical protein VFZ00_33325 [Solirubrobacter sp.]|nr:hypothetical protein [Solirubrobacter sp.]